MYKLYRVSLNIRSSPKWSIQRFIIIIIIIITLRLSHNQLQQTADRNNAAWKDVIKTVDLSTTFIYQNNLHHIRKLRRKIHNEELNDLYCSPNIVRVRKSRRMRRAGHVARMGEGRGVYRVLVGKPEGNRPLGRSRRRWEDNIKMNLQEVGCGGMDWIELAQDRNRWRALVNAAMKLRVP